MNTKPTAQLLQESKLLRTLPHNALQQLIARAQTRALARDQFFLRQGSPAVAVYLLIDGHAKVTQVTPDGHQVLFRIIGPGQEFGLLAVLSDLVYPLSVQTLDHATALLWHGEVLAQFMERYPALAFNALRILAEHNQELQQQYQALLTEKVQQRVAQVLVRLTEQVGRPVNTGILIDLPLSREELAEMAGTTLYSVSRTLSDWEDRGWVESGRERVVVRSVDALQRIAWPLPE